MSRPRRIYIDHSKLLLAIHQLTQAEMARLTSDDDVWHGWELSRLQEEGLKVDFERFAGRSITSGERLRFQQALRQLEQEGLVAICGLRATRVAITEAGLARLATETAPDA